MDKWNEIRTAYMLAKLGTLSATATELGIHRSTVMRHIDALEAHLEVVLFQRNDKGYLPTEAGVEVMRLGEVTDSHFSNLPQRLQNKEQHLEGKLTITTVSELAPMLMPVIKQYQQQHPAMTVEIIGDLRNFNLEYGEADVAIRGGDKPETPDNVVMPLFETQMVLMAHQSYLQQFGEPTLGNLNKHRFVAMNDRPAVLYWNEWIYDTVPADKIVVKGSTQQIISHAILSGCGIGALPVEMANNNTGLQPVLAGLEWPARAWTLVHRDMTKTPKVKAFIELLKQYTDWHIMLR
ncbi:LysR family transcriptional regulator [Bacterioplanoides sp.]|uniref:LysR family transcriptional regulator n=1 Tax=Bacterioplanoides sp. TaxID=2066072 RepID=UPI003B5D019A